MKAQRILNISIKKDRLLLGTFQYNKHNYRLEHFTCIPLERSQIVADIIANVSCIATHINDFKKRLSYPYRYATVALDRTMAPDSFEQEPKSSEHHKITCIQKLSSNLFYVSYISRLCLLQQQILAVCTQLSYLCIVPAVIAHIQALHFTHTPSLLHQYSNINTLYNDVHTHLQAINLNNICNNIPSTHISDSIELFGLYQLGVESYARR